MNIEASSPAALARHGGPLRPHLAANRWIVAALMVGMLTSGLALGHLLVPDSLFHPMRDWHKAAGVVVVALGVGRTATRRVVQLCFAPPIQAIPASTTPTTDGIPSRSVPRAPSRSPGTPP